MRLSACILALLSAQRNVINQIKGLTSWVLHCLQVLLQIVEELNLHSLGWGN